MRGAADCIVLSVNFECGILGVLSLCGVKNVGPYLGLNGAGDYGGFAEENIVLVVARVVLNVD